MTADNQLETTPMPGGMAFSIPAGWALNRAIQIDDACPGFLAHVCRARLAWRQMVWASLAAGADTNPDVILRLTGDAQFLSATDSEMRAEFGRVVARVTPRDLSEIVLGGCPEGWIGALRKLHGQPLSQPDSYTMLFRLFASDDPMDRRRSAALAQVAALDEEMIVASMALNETALITPTIIRRLRSREEVRRFEAGVAAVRSFCSWATNDDIRDAASAGPDRLGRSWLRSILSKADRPCPDHHPCDADPALHRITVKDTKAVGQEFENCLEPSRILPKALSGVWALIVWRDAGIIIDTRMDDGGVWHVERVHRRRNARVEIEHLVQVRQRLEPLGVRCFVPALPDADLSGIGRAWGGWEEASFAAFEID